MAVLDHIGIAVENIEAVEKLFADLLGKIPYKTEDIRTQGVRTHFIDGGSAKLELLEALSPESPVARFLEKHREGVHHLAFDVSNIKATWKRMQHLGYTPLGDEPQPGADGKLIFFLHPRDTYGMLIEFCQKRRAPLVPTRVPYDGEHLAVYELGTEHEPSIVLLHGAAGCTQIETEPLAQRLSRHFRVLALDFAGHGRSNAYAGRRFAPDLFIDNTHAVFEHFGLEHAHLFGFSLGGLIALSYAARRPQRVNKVAVHATNLLWDPSLVDVMLTRLDHEAIRANSAELVQYLEDAHGKENWIRLFERMKQYSRDLHLFWKTYTRTATEVAAPTLITAVDQDDLLPIQSPIHLFEHLADSRLAILPGQRHALQSVDLDLLLPLLLRHFGTR